MADSFGDFQGGGFMGSEGGAAPAIVNTLSGGIGWGLGKKLKKPGPPGKNLDKQLAAFSRELAAKSRPTRTAYYQQLAQALQGHAVTARQPDTQLALEHRLAGSSAAQQQAIEGIAEQGLGRSTAGAASVGGAQAAGGQTVALAPLDVLMQYLQAAPAAVVGQAQQGVIQPLGQLGEIAAQRYLQEMEAQGAAYSGIGGAIGSLAGYGATRLNWNNNPAPGGGGGGGQNALTAGGKAPIG